MNSAALFNSNRKDLSRPFNIGRWTRGYHRFFFFQLIHIGFLAILQTTEPNSAVLMTSGLVNVFVYGFLLLGDMRFGGDDINPFWFYLGMSALRLGFGTCFVALLVMSGDLWVLQLGQFDPYDWLMKGHLLLLGGDYLFIGGYFLFRRQWNKRNFQVRLDVSVKNSKVYISGLAIALVAYLIRFLGGYLPLDSLGQITSYVAEYGVPAGVFMMLDSCRRRSNRTDGAPYILPIVLLAFAVSSGFSSYMKTDLLISLFPLLLIGIDSMTGKHGNAKWRMKMRGRHFLLLGLVLYFFVFTISAYSSIHRKGYWENMGTGMVRPTEEFAPDVLPDLVTAMKGSIPGTREFGELQKYPSQGAWQMLARLSVTTWGATAVGLTARYGVRHDNVIAEIIWSIIPRVLYPNKPEISRGRETAVELGQATSVSEATSATSLSMFGYAYRSGGILSVIFMSVVSGFGFAFVTTKFLRDWRFNPISAMVMMILVYAGLHWKESDDLAGIPFYLYILIVFGPLAYGWRRLVIRRRVGERL